MEQENTFQESQEYTSFDEILPDFGVEIGKDELFTIQNADVVAMSCCNQTDGACWTQM